MPVWNTIPTLALVMVMIVSSCKSTRLSTVDSNLSGVMDDEKILLLVKMEGQDSVYEFIVCYCIDMKNPRYDVNQCVRAFRTSHNLHPLFRFKQLTAGSSIQREMSASQASFLQQTTQGAAASTEGSALQGVKNASPVIASGAAVLNSNKVLQDVIDPATGKVVRMNLINVDDIPASVVKTSDELRAVLKVGDAQAVVQVAEGAGGTVAQVTEIADLVTAPRSAAVAADTVAAYTKYTERYLRDALVSISTAEDQHSKVLYDFLKRKHSISATGDSAVEKLLLELMDKPDRGLRLLEQAQEYAAISSQNFSEEIRKAFAVAEDLPIDKQLDVYLPKIDEFLDSMKFIYENNGNIPISQKQLRLLQDWRAFLATKVADLRYHQGVMPPARLTKAVGDLHNVADRVRKVHPDTVMGIVPVAPAQYTRTITIVKEALSAHQAQRAAVKPGLVAAKVTMNYSDEVVGAVATAGKFTVNNPQMAAKVTNKLPPKMAAVVLGAMALGGGIMRLFGGGVVGSSKVAAVNHLPIATPVGAGEQLNLPVLQIPHPGTEKELLDLEFRNVQLISRDWGDIAGQDATRHIKVSSVDDILKAMVEHFDPARGSVTARGAGLITHYCVPTIQGEVVAPRCVQVLQNY